MTETKNRKLPLLVESFLQPRYVRLPYWKYSEAYHGVIARLCSAGATLIVTVTSLHQTAIMIVGAMHRRFAEGFTPIVCTHIKVRKVLSTENDFFEYDRYHSAILSVMTDITTLIACVHVQVRKVLCHENDFSSMTNIMALFFRV